MLSDPEARKHWQAAPVAETVTQTGPWLKPQIQASSTSLKATARIESHSAKEAVLSVTIHNTGKVPAYPVGIALHPDLYSVLWTDNYFWLASDETVTLQGTARLDMSGLDQISNPPAANPADLLIRVSAWNAAAIDIHL